MSSRYTEVPQQDNMELLRRMEASQDEKRGISDHESDIMIEHVWSSVATPQ